MADEAAPQPSAAATTVKKLTAWYDSKEVFGVPYAGFVPGVLTTMVIATAIAGYWRNASWTLPAMLDGLLAAAWGFVMAHDANSQLKALCVVAMVANALIFLLVWDFVPPVLASLTVQGFAQYVVQRAGTNGKTGGTNP